MVYKGSSRNVRVLYQDKITIRDSMGNLGLRVQMQDKVDMPKQAITVSPGRNTEGADLLNVDQLDKVFRHSTGHKKAVKPDAALLAPSPQSIIRHEAHGLCNSLFRSRPILVIGKIHCLFN